MTSSELQTLSDKIDGLAVVVGRLGVQVDNLVEPGAAPMCAVHEHRMGVIDKKVDGIAAVQGRYHRLVVVMGAVGYGIAAAIKGLFIKGPS